MTAAGLSTWAACPRSVPSTMRTYSAPPGVVFRSTTAAKAEGLRGDGGQEGGAMQGRGQAGDRPEVARREEGAAGQQQLRPATQQAGQRTRAVKGDKVLGVLALPLGLLRQVAACGRHKCRHSKRSLCDALCRKRLPGRWRPPGLDSCVPASPPQATPAGPNKALASSNYRHGTHPPTRGHCEHAADDVLGRVNLPHAPKRVYEAWVIVAAGGDGQQLRDGRLAVAVELGSRGEEEGRRGEGEGAQVGHGGGASGCSDIQRPAWKAVSDAWLRRHCVWAGKKGPAGRRSGRRARTARAPPRAPQSGRRRH